MFASPQDSYFEAQTANGIVFGDGALGRWFGLEEAMEWGSCDGIRSVVRWDTRELARPLVCKEEVRWTHSGMLAVYKPQKMPCYETYFVGHFEPGFSASRIVRDKILFV